MQKTYFNFFGFWESFNNTCHPPKTIIDCSDITSYGCKVDDVDWLFKLKYNPLLSHCSSGRKVADSEHPCRYRLKAMKSLLAARTSLQRPINNQIATPHQLFEFAESEIKVSTSTMRPSMSMKLKLTFLSLDLNPLGQLLEHIDFIAFNRYRQGCSESATFLPLLQ